MFFVKSTDGVKIAVYDLNPGGCQTVFLIHGWPLSHKIYEYQLEPLLERNYRVVMIDLRGFGESDAPSCGYSYDQMAADVHQVVKELNLTCFTLVGFSMGGAIALRYMRCYQGYGVTKLILLAAAAPCWTKRPDFPYGKTKEEANQLICLGATDRPKLCENFSHMLFAECHSEALIDWFKEVALSSSMVGTIQTAYSLRDEDGRKDLDCVHVPTGIFHGEKDLIVPDDLAQYQCQHIKGSKMYRFENSGHGIFYDELEHFNHCFFEFLEGC